MLTPYFLATRADYAWMALGLVVAIAESAGDPIATILVGKVFKDLQNAIAGSLASEAFSTNVRTYSVCLVGIAGYTSIVNWVGYSIWISLGYRQGHYARLKLYQRIMMQTTKWFDGNKILSGQAVTYYKDIQDIETAAGITMYEFTAMAVGFCAQIGVAFYYSWAVTLVCLAGVPVLVVIGSLISPAITQKVLAAKSILDLISSRLTWIIEALETVQMYGRERYEAKTLDRQMSTYTKISIKYWILFKLQEGLSRAVVLLIFVQGFYFGSYMVRNHGLNSGDVITVFFACLAASGLLQQLMNHLVEWNKGMASAQRLAEAFKFNETEALFDSIGLMPGGDVLISNDLRKLGWTLDSPSSAYDGGSSTKAEPENSMRGTYSLDTILSEQGEQGESVAIAEDVAKGVVSFSNVVFSYPSRQEIILAGMSLNFAPGTLNFVLGSSGSGKSTIAALLSKEYAWQAGEVAIDGHGVDLLSKAWIERNVYVAEQVPKLFDVSLLDNIKIGSRHPDAVSMEQVKQVCETACAEFIWELPAQLDTLGSYPLSGGQLQRISICRALISNAPITVFDEATSALDPRLQLRVLEQVFKFRQSMTTVVITHDHSIIPTNCPVHVIHEGVATTYRTISEVALFPDEYPAARPSESDSIVDEPCLDLQEDSARQKDYTSVDLTTGKRIRESNFVLFRSIPNKLLLFASFIITTIHAAINPVFSFIFSKLIMGIITPKSSKTTMWAMLVLMCAMLDGIAVIASVTLQIVGEKWLQAIREHIVKSILDSRHPRHYSEMSSYYTKLLMSDAEKSAEIITRYWPNLLSMTVLGLVGLIWSMVTGWALTLVGISLLPVFVLLNQWYKWLVTKWTGEREKRRASVMRLMSDLVTPAAFRTVKIQHLERFFEDRYRTREQELHSLTATIALRVGFGYGALKSFPYILESLILWYGMHLIVHGFYAAQTTMTIFSLIMFTVITIDQLSANIGGIGVGFESSDRITKAINEFKDDRAATSEESVRKQSFEIRTPPNWTSISFHRVEVRGQNSTMILKPFSIHMNVGDVVALVGPSGVGKSTIARLLLRLLTPTAGEIVVDSRLDLESLSRTTVRESVALVNQMPLDFFDGSIEDNLLYALDNINDTLGLARMIEVCELCGVHSFVTSFHEGYSTNIKNGMLSGGQMQRLGIARALMRRPRVLILDEVTSALDKESKQTILSLIRDLKQRSDMIIIMITHQMDVANAADYIVEVE